MIESKFLKCTCAQCGGRIEFPADGIGQTVECPHCHWRTELVLDAPEETSARPARSLKWAIAGIVILAIGVVGVVAAMVLTQRLMRKGHGAPRTNSRAVATNAAAGVSSTVNRTNLINGFSVSDVKIVKTPNTSLIYASGTVQNEMERQRLGVTVEIDLFDGAGNKLGNARDYNRDAIEPRGTWAFRALLVQKKVESARVSDIREQK